MSNYVLQMIVNNAAICLGLALIAHIVGRIFKRPSMTHLIWLLVLVKLLTPPVLNIPAFPVSSMAVTNSPAVFGTVVPPARQDIGNVFLPVSPESERNSLEGDFGPAIKWKQLLFLTWLLGSGIVFAWSLSQVYRFQRLLKKESESANPEICEVAMEIAPFLGLRKIPEIHTMSTRLSPMVWWIGGRVKIVVPDVLLERMETQELRWILAHELAHVRRGDFYIRWVEWLTCVLFWWHPVAWWARRNLRINEELCCDELVLSCLNPQPVTYGESLLKTVEILSGSKHNKPILASGINSGELLKRRVRIILSNKWKTVRLRRAQAFILLGGLMVLPLGLKSAQTRNQDMVHSQEEEATLPSSIPHGMRAIAVRVDNVIGTDYVLPGTRVDVIRTSISPESSKGVLSRVILEDVQVLTAGPAMEGNSEGQPRIVGTATLLVRPEQAKELVLAESDRIMLVLRNPLDAGGSTEWRAGLFTTQGSDSLPTVIPDGMRAISVRVDRIIGADYVRLGMRVDVFRTGTQPDGNGEIISGMVLENIQVLAAGQVMEKNSNSEPKNILVVTLLVTPEQADELVLAESDLIRLRLRNPPYKVLRAELRIPRLFAPQERINEPQRGIVPSFIPIGMRALSVKVDSVIGNADSVSPGTRVDIIKPDLSLNGSELDSSRIIFENIEILMCSQPPEQNSDDQPQTLLVVTLLLTPEQAQKLMLAGTDRIQLAVCK